MKKTIFCISIWLLNLPAFALDYNDFPPDMQKVLDERIAELKSNEGICIAGSVIKSDGAYVGSGKDIQINFLKGVDEPLWIYIEGWFIMKRTFQPPSYPKSAKLVLRAFGYDPIDASIEVTKGQMTYAEFVMQKTSSEKMAAITGTVVNDNNEPVGGATVCISFPLSYSVANGNPQLSIKTEPNGHYSFEGLSPTNYNLWIPGLSEYAAIAFDATPVAGKTIIKDVKLYKNLSIIIDYGYQADGSRNFTGGNLQTGSIEWANGSDGLDFSDGKLEGYEKDSLRDIEMRQNQNNLKFQIFYNDGNDNGFFDQGAVNFDSVTEAPPNGYSKNAIPVIGGHVYIVKTYENKYAKFIVRNVAGENFSICPFSPVVPALDYNDFPPNLQKVLDKTIADLNTSTGVFIAGKITMSDGAKINGGEDVILNFTDRGYMPIWVNEDGWFMMERPFPKQSMGPSRTLSCRAFGYEPKDINVVPLKGEITYVECTMQKVTDENLATISGIVVDDQNKPFQGAEVHLSFPFANYGKIPYRIVTTNSDGKYSFDGLSSTQHSIVATAPGYALHYVNVTPSAGEILTQDLKLYPNYKVVIDYVFQADGNCIFDGGDLQTGTIEWVNGNNGVDFSDGKVEGYEPNSLRDLELRQIQGKMRFGISYSNGQGNGFYDKGAVDFNSVIEVPSSGYSTEDKPCVVGHTYIVKTNENKYAKFIVKSISGDK
jgi:hypothetical protein